MARLIEACNKAGLPEIGPTRLQMEFNARSEKTVTVHAARKWLMGESIPTQEKLRILAQWLHVPPDWLRYGSGEATSRPTDSSNALPSSDMRLFSDIRLLTAENKKLIDGIVSLLIKAQKS